MTRDMRVFYFVENYIAYDAGAAWQQRLAGEVREGAPEALALLQYAPVYTLGRRPRFDHLLVGPYEFERAGATVSLSDRGGDVTYHGPGQLVIYPILNLRDRGLGPRSYVDALESVLIETAARFGVEAARVDGRPGVWVGNDKLAAIGVRIEGGVSTHGCALNVSTDLTRFESIVPCGLHDAGVTSLERLLGRAPAIQTVADTLLDVFERKFDVQTTIVSREEPPAATRELVMAHGG